MHTANVDAKTNSRPVQDPRSAVQGAPGRVHLVFEPL